MLILRKWIYEEKGNDDAYTFIHCYHPDNTDIDIWVTVKQYILHGDEGERFSSSPFGVIIIIYLKMNFNIYILHYKEVVYNDYSAHKKR